MNFNTMMGGNYKLDYEELVTNFEVSRLKEDFYGNNLRGYFVPPLTTRYRFYMACDDHCLLDFA